MSSTMICMTDTSVIPFPTLGSTHIQASNTPISPFPRIPRGGARSSPPFSFSDTLTSDSNTSEPSNRVEYTLGDSSTTRVRYSSESSSSSTPSDEAPPTIIPRSKRVASKRPTAVDSRDIFNPLTPASTPVKSRSDGRSSTDLGLRKQTFLSDPSDEEDSLQSFPVLRRAPFCKISKLRLEGSTGKHVRHASDSNVTPSQVLVTLTPNTNQPPPAIRKKSGQPIKSSLKNTRRPELHVVTNGSFPKSEPATPTHTKTVHFDSKLERVKLFLAEQKPLAVSRDGSPTSDTSGDEFPSFIYGNASRENKRVTMLLPNMPSSPRKEENVALQELILSQDQRTITGHVRVRNIAYEKWLAVRFTLDWWQTTSEVTARYEKSIEGGAFDIFTFSIRLHDIWSRIEDKTIFIALRYTVAGQEYWDNNTGKNYHIKFVSEFLSEPSSAVDDTNLRDLDSRLQDLARARSAPIPTAPYRLGRSFSADYQYSSFAKPPFSRYDVASVYRMQLRNASSPPNHHMRTHAYPSGAPATAGPTVAPWSKASNTDESEDVAIPPRPRPPPFPGSLQEGIDGILTPPAHFETNQVSPCSPSLSRSQDGRERNHRRGFTDRVMEGSPDLRRTPPGSPLKFDVTSGDATVQLPRTRSYPLAAEVQGAMGNSLQRSLLKLPLSIQIAPVGGGGSEEPTPYAASQSSSSSNSSCTPLFSPDLDLPRSDRSYKQFLDRFCFYTGTDSLIQESSEALPRS